MNYNEILQKAGKTINPKIYYYDSDNNLVEYEYDDILEAKLSFNASLTGTIMKCLTCNLYVSLPSDTAIYFSNTATYGEYSKTKVFGPYYVYSSEYNADDETYDNTLYDAFLNSMVDYEALDITYPCTVYDFFVVLCEKCGYTTNITTFPNATREMSSDIYDSIGYTYRDVLDDIGGATATLFEIDGLEVKICSLGTDEITIDDDILKNQNISFGEHYGPINSIILSRSADSDKVYMRDETLTKWNEYKISDNQLMNYNDRSDYLEELYNALYGLEYDIYDLELVGYGGFNVLDKITVSTGDNTYSSYVFNNEQTFTQGYEECIYAELQEESVTDYTTSDTTDKKINQTYIIADKANQQITAVVSEIGDRTEKSTTITQDIDTIASQISSVTDLVKDDTMTSYIEIDDAVQGEALKFYIYGSMSLIYPEDTLYPSDDLYPLDTYLIIEDEDGNQNKIYLPFPSDEAWLNYLDSSTYDEFYIEDGIAYLVRRVGTNANGDLVALVNEETIELGELSINLNDSYNKIWLESFYGNNIYYGLKYVTKNELTEVFATTVELNSAITQSADSITAQVEALIEDLDLDIEAKLELKVNLETLCSELSASADDITIEGDRITIKSTYFTLNSDGSLEATNATFNNVTINGGTLCLSSGATVTGDNGLLTNLTFPGYTRGYYFEGSGDYIPLGHVGNISSDSTQINALVFMFKLPENFTIKSAKVYITHSPIKWTYYDTDYETQTTTGYSRNLNLYKITDTTLTCDLSGKGMSQTSYTLISGALNFTGSSSSVTSAESSDISSSISTTSYNQLAVKTSDTTYYTSGSANMYTHTGGVVGYLEVIGYTNYT